LFLGYFGCEQNIDRGSRRTVMQENSIDIDETQPVEKQESEEIEKPNIPLVKRRKKNEADGQSEITMDVNHEENSRAAESNQNAKVLDDKMCKKRERILDRTLKMHSSNLFDASYQTILDVAYHKMDHTKVTVTLADGRSYTVSGFFDGEAIRKLQIFETGKTVYLN